MVEASDEIYTESRTSCTREEVAAKLIGWLQGSVRRRIVHVDGQGRISADQLPTAHSLGGPLIDQLEELRETARWEFIDTVENSLDLSEIQDKENAVNQWDEMIERATYYLAKIDHELASISNGETSVLKIDPVATKESGTAHITLVSADLWSKKEFGVSFFPSRERLPSTTPENNVATQADQKPWLIADPRDPDPDLPWYTPARFFARLHVEEDPRLVDKRKALAAKVVVSLSKVGLNKRGGVKPFNPDTVLKAFSNVKFG